MSYATKKGLYGQYELRDFLQETFKEWGFQFISISGSEKTKKLAAGDVILRESTDPNMLCVVRDYFLEAKKQAHPNIFRDFQKAEDDARMWGKVSAILYVSKQAAGSKGYPLVVMSPKTFARILKELQGYRQEQYEKEHNTQSGRCS